MVRGDVLDADSLTEAFDGCRAAFYLVHSMGSGDDFADTDARAAGNFRDAADAAGVGRIVYLGGMGTGADLSAHLASRHRVGEILASGSTPTTELRAAVIIGSGSLSFEMLRYLTEVLPVMITPRWVDTKCQPIAIRDVLHYLVHVLDDDEGVDRVLDIGGPDILSYAEMMQTYASVAGLRRRIILPVPVLSPSLSSRWVGLVTPLPSAIARPLIDSLRHEVVMTNHDIEELVPHEPIDFRTAVELAVRRTSTELVVTRWSDSGYTPADTIPGDPEWAGGATLTDHQTVETTARPRRALRGIRPDRRGERLLHGGLGVAHPRCDGSGDRWTGHPARPPSPGRSASRRVARLLAGADGGARRGTRSRSGDAVPGRAWLSWRITDGDEPGTLRWSRPRGSPRVACGAARTGTPCCRSTSSSSPGWPVRSSATPRPHPTDTRSIGDGPNRDARTVTPATSVGSADGTA